MRIRTQESFEIIQNIIEDIDNVWSNGELETKERIGLALTYSILTKVKIGVLSVDKMSKISDILSGD